MKKLVAMLLAGTMVFSLAACGGSSSASTSNDAAKEAEEAVEEAAEEDAAAAEAAADEAAADEKAAEDAAADEAAADTAEAGRKFIVGFDAEYPPYGYMDEASGDYTGFDLEMAEELCKRRGWELVKQPINWDNKDAELDSGSIDCIWNGMTYTGREEMYTWSEPYVDNSIVMAVAADSDIKTLDDLAGKIVITQSESSAYTALESEELAEMRASFAELQQNPSYNTCFQDLKAGAVQAIAVDIGVARYQLANNPDEFRILDEPISTEQYAIAFKLGNEELRDQVMETLNEMVADGTFMEIAGHYTDYNLPDMVILGK